MFCLKLMSSVVLTFLLIKVTTPPNATNKSDKVIESLPVAFVTTKVQSFIFFSTILISNYIQFKEGHVTTTSFESIGAIVCVLGCVLRLWSYQILDNLFTFDLAIRKNHKIVKTGPYRMVRHPSYTGMMMASLGFHMFHFSPNTIQALDLYLGSIGSWFIMIWVIASVVLSVYFFVIRIPKEEKMMQNEFKESWNLYVKDTWKLIPFVY